MFTVLVLNMCLVQPAHHKTYIHTLRNQFLEHRQQGHTVRYRFDVCGVLLP